MGGPQQFRLNDFVLQGLRAHHDRRVVVADPAAGYFGVEVDERTLVPGKDALLGETNFETWLLRSTAVAFR
ncbi:Putative secreted protein [Acidisarcina polymorpha]|uniref:Secreted protein n=1 Tax=Acidisarcina polymorpha TaxID=2211140 RepID=A0A2Z5FV41_9BACT|nr:Putative secreted protein [Acidisarcina polymorpha]